MNFTTFTKEAKLIAGAGDADDALDLMRRLARAGETEWAVAVRRSVTRGELDGEALLKAVETLRQQAIERHEQNRRELRKATRDLIRHGGDNLITRAARQLTPYI
ncbi:hypothetical protein ACR6C2_07965 [Streptomyces sp. INA 01156]